MIFEAAEATEAGLKYSNVEETQYRRKEWSFLNGKVVSSTLGVIPYAEFMFFYAT